MMKSNKKIKMILGILSFFLVLSALIYNDPAPKDLIPRKVWCRAIASRIQILLFLRCIPICYMYRISRKSHPLLL